MVLLAIIIMREKASLYFQQGNEEFEISQKSVGSFQGDHCHCVTTGTFSKGVFSQGAVK